MRNVHPLNKISTAKLLVAPSILAANFAELGNEIRRIEDGGADIVHIDVMDGHFVPNLTIGPPVVESIRKTTELPFDVHLMLTNPLPFVKPFAWAGADNITIHVECGDNVEGCIREIRSCGISAGISLKPKTPVETIFPLLEKVDLVLVMTVEPGFGGQSFMPGMMGKVRELKRKIKDLKHPVHIEVDGGIDERTVPAAAEAGANMMVAGTMVFRNPKGVKFAIESLHAAGKFLSFNS